MSGDVNATGPRVTLHVVSSLDGFIARKDNSVSWLDGNGSVYEAGVSISQEEAEAEQAKLDSELQLHGGPVAHRLQHAERHLAELERIIPVESQRREVAQELSSADRRVKLAEEKHASALANWKSAYKVTVSGSAE